jgi:hypothetical protein
VSGPYFDTPFGHIELSFSTNSVRTASEADVFISSPPDGRVFSWTGAPVHAELLIARAWPELPPGLAVESCYVAVWHVRARVPTAPCAFDARWAAGARPPRGGPTSGQALNALTWSNESIELSLGAPDAEGLAGYHRAGIPLPTAWRELLDVDDLTRVQVEDYFTDGLRLRLPGLSPGESACAHFAVAWANAANKDAPWFAVDLGPPIVRLYLDQMSNER